MVADKGIAMVQGMPGAQHAYWSRPVDAADELIQHSFWVFDTENNARAAEKTFNTLRDVPDAPAEFVSCDVCEIIGEG